MRRAFRTLLPLPDDLEPHLRGALADILARPGSLVRAQLAYGLLVARAMPRRRALELATAVEYFHTASLVFDDLPAMDDAETRRGAPCPHRVHGEAAATLASLALITRAYDLLWQALAPLPREARSRAASLVAECLGAGGILDGQARDLHYDSATAGGDGAEAVARGKTVPLVRLALVLPALATAVPTPAVALLERLATAWGLAYQGVDDFGDVLMDERESGKSTARDERLGRPNLVHGVGRRHGAERLGRLLDEAAALIAALERVAPELAAPLVPVQEHLEAERRRVGERLDRVAA